MNDFEVEIFNEVYSVAAPLCAKNHFISKRVVNPVGLPAGSMIEIGNDTVRERQSSTPKENYSLITYQFDGYALTKRECRQLFKAVDEKMISMNFSRISGQYIDNPGNLDVVRYTARYQAVIDQNGTIYRRT